jgi:hypothetical protein
VTFRDKRKKAHNSQICPPTCPPASLRTCNSPGATPSPPCAVAPHGRDGELGPPHRKPAAVA